MAEFKREDVVTVLREKSGYYKKDLRKVLDALEETLIAIMATAQIDDPVEIRLFDGFYVQAKREPERPATDPRTGKNIIAREKIKPNAFISPIHYDLAYIKHFSTKNKRLSDNQSSDSLLCLFLQVVTFRCRIGRRCYSILRLWLLRRLFRLCSVSLL